MTRGAKRTRHARYKVGVCKMTVTVDNADCVRAKRKSAREGYPTTSAWLRRLIHATVCDEPLTDADLDALRQMQAKQEA